MRTVLKLSSAEEIDTLFEVLALCGNVIRKDEPTDVKNPMVRSLYKTVGFWQKDHRDRQLECIQRWMGELAPFVASESGDNLRFPIEAKG
jgi:hypothetical protein